MLRHLLQYQPCLPLLLVVVPGSRDGVGCVCTNHNPAQHAVTKGTYAAEASNFAQIQSIKLSGSPNRASKALDSLTAIYAGHSPLDA